MNPRLLEIVEALEQCWVDPEQAEVEEVAELLQRRQVWVDALAGLDLKNLEEEEGRQLAERVRQSQARDATLLLLLEERRQELEAALRDAMAGRQAARGYRPPIDANPGAIREKA